MELGYARKYGRRSVDEQVTALEKEGVNGKRLWVEVNGKSILARISFRKGDILKTMDGLRTLGDSRHDIVDELERIENAGAAVMDIQTGLRSDQRGAKMLHAAMAQIKGERSMGDRAAVIGRLGGLAARRRRGAEPRMTEDEARQLYADPTITISEFEFLSGWSKSAAWRKFSASGRNPGKFDPEKAIERAGARVQKRYKDGPERAVLGFVYFCQSGKKGAIKIGFSKTPVGRFSNLQSTNSRKLYLLKYIRGTQTVERKLHEKFSHIRVRGEWFKATSELVDFIERLPVKKMKPQT